MTEIIIATVVVAVIGLAIGFALVVVGNKFRVEVDERESAVRELLPGNNCGACGYAGCDAVAAAIAKGDAPVNACPVCSADAVKKIGGVMGVEATAATPKVAFVRCSGTCDASPAKVDYKGIQDCRAAALSGMPVTACTYGCIGLESCAKVCPENAITVKDGVASVNQSLCVGCGLCAKTCPRGLISLIPVGKTEAVRCSSMDRGPLVRKVCSAGCIGCGMCVKQCEFDAVHLEGVLAKIDPEKCTGCGKCAAKCPAKVIVPATPTRVS